ncbi:hypothetical protein Tsedi_00904 [Tepidimonas sediminis]|uniref:Cytochrome c domain-containing protein n=1 Tax=Tepidimonas sediminis TaxID=2588941 RepID=A0A554WR80_9BURK|nr:urate hydroxylase PuuD [Tepidimonas sediminis]TSE26092.1 hypothetical protein Tsedi_00904 [Tepidimonas sediminis]
MEAYLIDWAGVLLRWLHVVAAIAWIGSSFYFVFLDNNLLKPTDPVLLERGVDGAMWAVHGGGFYHPQKYLVAPPRIDSKLHWFYWESYTTWLSGFALLAVSYLWHAEVYLVDPARMDWSPALAGAVAVGLLVAFWLVYDLTCRLAGVGPRADRLIAAVMLAVVAGACWLVTTLYPGRAAFLLVGAMLATAMSANVLFWIIPGQRKVVAALTSGQPVDRAALAIHGQRGKQRSVHNTYFTLPVLFAMLSNHWPMLTGAEHSAAVLFAMMLGGALIRQYFVQRHGYKLGRAPNPLPWALAGAAIIVAVIVALAPRPDAAVATPVPPAGAAATSGVTIQALVQRHCLACHAGEAAMKGVRLDSPAALRAHAAAIHQQVAVTRQMPLNNATGMTEAERAAVAAWFRAGAPVE